MFYEGTELVKGAHQHLALLFAFLAELGGESRYHSLNAALIVNFNGVESKTQVVKRLLLKSLILSKGCDDLGRHDMQDRLQEVEEADVLILIGIKELHVVDCFEISVLVSEIELLTAKQD